MQGPVPDQFNPIVTDMDATVAFYRKLGLTIPDTDPQWQHHHRTAALPGRIDLGPPPKGASEERDIADSVPALDGYSWLRQRTQNALFGVGGKGPCPRVQASWRRSSHGEG